MNRLTMEQIVYVLLDIGKEHSTTEGTGQHFENMSIFSIHLYVLIST